MAQEVVDRTALAARETLPFSTLPTWKGLDTLFTDGWGRRMMALEEFTEDGALVVRAELPGIDPDKDVQITTTDGVLRITAERTEREEKKGRRFHRRELRYGSFARTVPIPEGVDEAKIVASYKDGILEVKVPLPATPHPEPSHHVPVTRG